MRPDFPGSDPGVNAGSRLPYRAIAIRRRWWVIAPFFVIGTAAFTASQFVRPLYRSQAIILVEQQKVPEQYVTPNVIADLQYRLDSLTQQILSRTRLQRIIEDFGLYTRERARMSMDEVIDLMRAHVQVDMIQGPGRQTQQLTAFKVAYAAEDPRSAQRVANELTSTFIESNVRARTQQSISTTQFLENQLEEAHKDLMEQEQRLRDYKTKYLGELPEQEAGNLQILSSLEAQMQISAAALERAEQQKIYLESVRTQYRNLQKVIARRPPPASANPELAGAEKRLSDLQNRLSEMRVRFKEDFPDIPVLMQQIADANANVQRLRAEARHETADPQAEGAVNEPPDAGLIDVEGRLKAVMLEIETRKADTARLRQRIEELQRRVSIVPMREQQLAEVTRNYENSKLYYQSLLQKKLGSELATNLEKRQQAEQFRILDPATLPQKPSQMNRFAIVALGWAGGLGCGLALAAVREFTDSRLYGAGDLAALTSAGVLGRIPVLRSKTEKRRTRLRQALEAVSVLLLVLLSLGTTLHSYLRG